MLGLANNYRPATQTDDGSGEEYASTETWIWILMSRPMVSYDPNDKVTIPSNSPSSYAGYLDTIKAEPSLKTTPPNFPKPIPGSWIVFAAPKANVTAYSEAAEDLDQQPSHYPFTSKSKKIQKRIDYDFSFSGIPIFEFSSSDLFTDESKKPQFLSVEQQGAWSTNDSYEAYEADGYERIYKMWQAGEWGVRESFMASATNLGLDENNKPKATMPAPNRGLWWRVFYQRMFEDVARWEKIRRAMGLGMCRVVVRWDEYPDEGDVDMTGVGAAVGKKAKRVTRSESRRRSGLGLGEGSGNREPVRAGGAEKEKKVKKR